VPAAAARTSRPPAAGFLLKDAQPEELRQAVRVVAAGQALLSPAVTLRVMRAAAGSPVGSTQPELLTDLTEREREVLAQVAKGRSNSSIWLPMVRA
jgi:DNA-binding NarL/FixJ family response regulator